jgi:hypothetical protein
VFVTWTKEKLVNEATRLYKENKKLSTIRNQLFHDNAKQKSTIENQHKAIGLAQKHQDILQDTESQVQSLHAFLFPKTQKLTLPQ